MADQTLAEFLQELQKDGGAVVSASDEIADNNFNEQYWLQDDVYLSQAERLTGVFQGAFEPDRWFNVQKALQIARSTPNGIVRGQMDQHLTTQTLRVEALVEQLKQITLHLIGIPISDPGFLDHLQSALTGMFVGLGGQDGEKYLSWGDETGSSTSYTYNLFFAVQSLRTGAVMAVLPLSFDITASVDRKRLESLTVKDSARFATYVRAVTFMQTLDTAAV